MNYAMIEAPICIGSPTSGSESAYRHLMANGLQEIFPTADTKYIRMEKIQVDDRYYPPNLRDPRHVMAVGRRVYENVSHALSAGQFPIIIGGDHSIAMGSISAVSERYGVDNTVVLYLDGHTDIHTEKSTLTGYLHGMPLGIAMGLCDDALTPGRQKTCLYGRNTYILGARSIDSPEYGIIQAQNVHLTEMEDIRRIGLSAVLDAILPKIEGKAVHISLDVDCLSPESFPATGYLMPGGLTMDELLSALRRVLGATNVISFECVEYNPTLDHDGNCLAHLLTIFALLREMTCV